MYSGICHWHALILALPVDKNPLLLVCKLKKQTNQNPNDQMKFDMYSFLSKFILNLA